jgi:hypothetical protein
MKKPQSNYAFELPYYQSKAPRQLTSYISHLGGRDQEVHSSRPDQKKEFKRLHLNHLINSWARWHMAVIPATWEAEIRRIMEV